MFVIGDIIRNNAAKFPHKVGLIHDGVRFTWQQTEERVNSLAQGAIAAGAKKGDGIGILLRNCHQWVECALMAAKLGLRMVPLNMMLGVPELLHIINDSGIRFLVADAGKAEIVSELLSETTPIEKVIGCGGDHAFDEDFEALIERHSPLDPSWQVSPDDISVIIYTSGTTGFPKGAVLTHANLVAAAICEGYEYRLTPSSITTTFIPLFFIGGWGATCLPYLMRGCTQHILSFDAETVLRLFEEERINCTVMVPTMINILCNHPDVRSFNLSSIRSIPFAGSPLPVEHWRRAVDIFGNVFVSMYGFTEGCGTISILQPEDVDPYGGDVKSQRMSSCGRPMIQTAMKLVDAGGREVPPGSDETGEIQVKGPTIFREYWNLPQASAEVLQDGWFKTGDLARRDEHGFYYIVDRKKDLIISGGINVYPREVEEVIYTHPSVMDCAVIGVDDEKWGETVKAVITLKPGKQVTESEIVDLCRKNLASYKKPTSVSIIEEMPRTASGKILKRRLRETFRPPSQV